MDRIRTPLQWFMLLFGATYALVGLMGFIGPLVQDGGASEEGRLLGIFAVDAEHNIFHLVSGTVIAAAAFAPIDTTKWVARAAALVFLGLAVWGFGALGATGDEVRQLGGMHVNPADNWLHIATSGLFGFFGFVPWAWHARVPERDDGRDPEHSGGMARGLR